MSKVIANRMCAQLDGEFVLFLLGVRLNKPWKFWKWAPVSQAVPGMLTELASNPDLGLLHSRTHSGFPNVMLVQYWRSFEALEAYARSQTSAHLPAWQAFNQAVGSNGDVGIWHETYVIRAGAYENVYNNMPPYGLGQAGVLKEARGTRMAARQRMASAAAT